MLVLWQGNWISENLLNLMKKTKCNLLKLGNGKAGNMFFYVNRQPLIWIRLV